MGSISAFDPSRYAAVIVWCIRLGKCITTARCKRTRAGLSAALGQQTFAAIEDLPTFRTGTASIGS